MNKLLMLAFLVTMMGLMATAAPLEKVEELELEDMAADEGHVMEEVAESREVREPGRAGQPGWRCRGRECSWWRARSGKEAGKGPRTAKKSNKAKKNGK